MLCDNLRVKKVRAKITLSHRMLLCSATIFNSVAPYLSTGNDTRILHLYNNLKSLHNYGSGKYGFQKLFLPLTFIVLCLFCGRLSRQYRLLISNKKLKSDISLCCVANRQILRGFLVYIELLFEKAHGHYCLGRNTGAEFICLNMVACVLHSHISVEFIGFWGLFNRNDILSKLYFRCQ